jgi:hypothetical protein
MRNRSNIIFNLLKASSFVLLLNGVVWAQASLKALKAMGEIASASQTTVNGVSAISGMTVFNSNRIRTAGQGAAIINLGKTGRIEFGPETDMTLNFTRTSIGGELHSSNVVISAPAGVAISIKTAKGMVTTDGQKPAVLTVYSDSRRARIIAHIGEAMVTSSNKDGLVKTNRVSEGEVLSQSIAAAVTRPAQIGGSIVNPSVADAAPDIASFGGLLSAGIGYSLPAESERRASKEEPFETSMSCRNSDKRPCRKKSEFKP